jgi:hypothetical protein
MGPPRQTQMFARLMVNVPPQIHVVVPLDGAAINARPQSVRVYLRPQLGSVLDKGLVLHQTRAIVELDMAVRTVNHSHVVVLSPPIRQYAPLMDLAVDRTLVRVLDPGQVTIVNTLLAMEPFPQTQQSVHRMEHALLPTPVLVILDIQVRNASIQSVVGSHQMIRVFAVDMAHVLGQIVVLVVLDMAIRFAILQFVMAIFPAIHMSALEMDNALCQMCVLVLLETLGRLVNFRFVLELLEIILKRFAVEMVHVLHRINVLVDKDGRDKSVKYRFASERWRMILLFALEGEIVVPPTIALPVEVVMVDNSVNFRFVMVFCQMILKTSVVIMEIAPYLIIAIAQLVGAQTHVVNLLVAASLGMIPVFAIKLGNVSLGMIVFPLPQGAMVY